MKKIHLNEIPLVDNTRESKIRKIKAKNKELKLVLFHCLICFSLVASAEQIYNHSFGVYFKFKSLLKYELVERKGYCNIFQNGFNEKVKVCPEDVDYDSLVKSDK